MRVKKVTSHSSCILHIGFFTNNDEEHFYTLSNNGELKEWLLNPDGSIILIEVSYLLRPGSEYLDYIGYPPTENTTNGHNIIISYITVSDNLLFCGYEDGLVIVWRQERRDVVDLNIIKSWKRSRTIVKKEEEDIIKTTTILEEKKIKKKENIDSKNLEIEEVEEEENESKNNKSNIYSEQSNNDLSKNNLNLNTNNNLNKSNSSTKPKLNLYEGPTMSKKYKNYIDKENLKKAYEENFEREGKYRIDDIILFSLRDDINFYKSSMVEEFEKKKEEKVTGENDFKYKYKNYSNIFWLKYLFLKQTHEISYLFYYNYQNNHILISASKNGSIMCYDIDDGKLLYSFNVSDYVKYICFCKEISKNKRITKTHLTLLCNSPHKIFLNLTKEKPTNMNIYDFKYNDFTKIIFNNNNFYLLGKRGECIVFNNNFEDEKKIMYKKAIPLYDIIQYKKNFLVFTSEFNMCLVEFNFENNKMNELFYIKFGMNKVTNLIYINDILYITNADKNVYSIDFNYEYRLYEERVAMKKEEKLSEEYNIYYELHKNKKKKKKKGKKGKGKKKTSSPGKKKGSPGKKKK